MLQGVLRISVCAGLCAQVLCVRMYCDQDLCVRRYCAQDLCVRRFCVQDLCVRKNTIKLLKSQQHTYTIVIATAVKLCISLLYLNVN